MSSFCWARVSCDREDLYVSFEYTMRLAMMSQMAWVIATVLMIRTMSAAVMVYLSGGLQDDALEVGFVV